MLLLVTFLITLKATAHALNITNFVVPTVAFEGQSVRLLCEYDLEGRSLYTLKWYFEEREFYRLEPKIRPRHTIFEVPFVTVDASRSNGTLVILTNLRKETSGQFTCEVTNDKNFKTEVSEATLNVMPSIKNKHTLTEARLSLMIFGHLFLCVYCSYFFHSC